jgi:hypothetical protein
MAEVRKNIGPARLSESTTCCTCGRPFLPGQEYAVDRAGPRFFYSHLDCREGAATAEREGRPMVAGRKPLPDVHEVADGVVEIFYRGHRYDAVADEQGGPVVWGLLHHSGEEPLAVERNPEVGLGGLISWLIHNR